MEFDSGKLSNWFVRRFSTNGVNVSIIFERNKIKEKPSAKKIESNGQYVRFVGLHPGKKAIFGDVERLGSPKPLIHDKIRDDKPINPNDVKFVK